MRAFGAVPWWCPNGCATTPGHISPDLLELLMRIEVERDFPLGTGWCKQCKQIVQGRWKDVRVTPTKRAA